MPPDLATAFTAAERKLVADKLLERCDSLDGANDQMVSASSACQKAFDLARDVPLCHGERDGSCLTADQKGVLQRVFAGARDRGRRIARARYVPIRRSLATRGAVTWIALRASNVSASSRIASLPAPPVFS